MTADAKTAVAALAAAKDISALEAAISQASFLDTVPGDDRQKLRGKRVYYLEMSTIYYIPFAARH